MKQESGRSMIEMLGVLAIMGVITVGAIEMIQLAMNTQKRRSVTNCNPGPQYSRGIRRFF